MRLWSLHPKYLDSKGLVALWREGLLALKVLKGQTRGYRHHPQLDRFKDLPEPLPALRSYLEAVLQEAKARGYNFDPAKLRGPKAGPRLVLSRGQLLFERGHLASKLKVRDPGRLKQLPAKPPQLKPHPIFKLGRGPRADWEKTEQ